MTLRGERERKCRVEEDVESSIRKVSKNQKEKNSLDGVPDRWSSELSKKLIRWGRGAYQGSVPEAP